MAKFVATIKFVANIEIEADDADAAKAEAESIQEEHSVYADDVVKNLHDEAYAAGGAGNDPPLRRKNAFQLRNMDFVAGDVCVGRLP